jgi:tetratricopeptide (TPR) repeat protein
MFVKANKESDLAIESFPNQASLYFFNAYAQYKIGRLELALSTIDQGLIMTSQKPDLKAQFLGIQSLIFLELEKNEQAGIAIKESQFLDKNCTFTILASSLKEMLEKKDNGLANDILKNVNNPKFKGLQDSKLIHALALFYTKNFPAAQKLYSDLTRNPDFVSAFWFEKTGDAYALGNQSDEALKFWNKAWKLKQNAKLDQKIKSKKYLD